MGRLAQRFIYVHKEIIVIRQIRLLPWGLGEEQIHFNQIVTVQGQFRRFKDNLGPYYRYRIFAVTDEQQGFLVRVGPRQLNSDYTEPDPPTIAFADSIAGRIGAELDLTSEVIR